MRVHDLLPSHSIHSLHMTQDLQSLITQIGSGHAQIYLVTLSSEGVSTEYGVRSTRIEKQAKSRKTFGSDVPRVDTCRLMSNLKAGNLHYTQMATSAAVLQGDSNSRSRLPRTSDAGM